MELISTLATTNWDTFAPDMIVGVTTGVVVGAVLLIAQGITQSRSSRAASQFAWESLKPKLRGAAFRGWERDLDSLTQLPPALVALDEIAASQPLSLWKSHLKKPDEALDLLMALVSLRAQFESNATAVEAALGVSYRYADIFRLANGLSGSKVERYVRARAYGPQAQSQSAYISAGLTDVEVATYSHTVDEIIGVPQMAVPLAMYQATTKMYEELLLLFRKRVQLGGNG
ncbi:hypothetical protein E3T24_04740 [Cryobacterium sp. TmT2-59]|uniref:hypothetical protein n=1 Tax=Cryobacterium sp. TmT2-59 TaxID=1259264 RepID=UPI001069B3D9|nr:hypothetical protein [Cryobacterium sp. TmT2-59]TFC87502.1 hypothetical protein E3T24_04740 [Cryobacterium sp. TmT2-59]